MRCLGLILVFCCMLVFKSLGIENNHMAMTIESVQKAGKDLLMKYPDRKEIRKYLDELDKLTSASVKEDSSVLLKVQQIQKAIFLQHPAFDHDLLFITRNQYAKDHHNTATIFQKGEINEKSFDPGGAMHRINLRTGSKQTLISTSDGMVRDPELDYEGQKIIFSYRKNKEDDYHIYELAANGGEKLQLTFSKGVSDIDPVYLPDGDVLFSSTREPKYCMCNRHIMANLFRMKPDGANIVQLGKSTLFEGHSTVLPDGRILYDRWEYVDRNFGDAQGLWTVNPDGTNHAIYYGNNMNSPGGVIDARPIPGTNKVLCIFGSCHDRPWGALVLLDRSKGVDGEQSVAHIWPAHSRDFIGKGNWDKFMELDVRYEDPFPLDDTYFLCSKSVFLKKKGKAPIKQKMGLFMVDTFGNEVMLHTDEKSCFDPMIIRGRKKETAMPVQTNYGNDPGYFYVQNVYEGTHMEGVEQGSIKYFRLVESPPKRSYGASAWLGQGQQAPGMNWHSFENKRILGVAPVEEDGSVYVKVPSNTFLYFQLLDENKKMIQSMRSGTMIQSGEVQGCIGCHEDRLMVPMSQAKLPMAMLKAPHDLTKGNHDIYNYAEMVQPIFDKHCMRCHDFGNDNISGLVLAGDKNPYFNASYIDLHFKKMIKPIGGGPSETQAARSWGSSQSTLIQVLEEGHEGVELSKEELGTLITWIDLNAVYYPSYESAFPFNPAGRSPITQEELERIAELCKLNLKKLGGHQRTVGPQISFDRPELSVCLLVLEKDSEDYNEVLDIIKAGKKRLKENPRAEMKGFLPHAHYVRMLEKYKRRMEEDARVRKVVGSGRKAYDERL